MGWRLTAAFWLGVAGVACSSSHSGVSATGASDGAGDAVSSDAAASKDGSDASTRADATASKVPDSGSHPDVASQGGSARDPVACDRPDTIPIQGSLYDEERRCFYAAGPVEGFCGTTTNSPTGWGDAFCVVSPSGDLYMAYIAFGVEVSADWHHSQGHVEPSTLTEADKARCAAMAEETKGAYPDEPGIMLGLDAFVSPACSGEDAGTE